MSFPSRSARQAAIEQHDVEAHKAHSNLDGEKEQPSPQSLIPPQLIKLARGKPRSLLFWRMVCVSMGRQKLTGEINDA